MADSSQTTKTLEYVRWCVLAVIFLINSANTLTLWQIRAEVATTKAELIRDAQERYPNREELAALRDRIGRIEAQHDRPRRHEN